MQLRHLTFLLLLLPFQTALGYNYDTLFVHLCGDTVKIYNLEWEAWCVSRFVMSASVQHDSILVVEMDTAARHATCMCSYGTETSVVGLQAGTYHVVLYRGHLHEARDTTAQFVKAITFTLGQSSSLAFGATFWGGACGQQRPEDLNSVPVGESPAPGSYYLAGNYPNPFNPTTTIAYQLPTMGHVRLSVLDLLGHEVALLEEGVWTAGRHEVVFDAKRLPSGVYFCRLQSGNHTETLRMVLAR